jgi:hypothetical protein
MSVEFFETGPLRKSRFADSLFETPIVSFHPLALDEVRETVFEGEFEDAGGFNLSFERSSHVLQAQLVETVQDDLAHQFSPAPK